MTFVDPEGIVMDIGKWKTRRLPARYGFVFESSKEDDGRGKEASPLTVVAFFIIFALVLAVIIFSI